VIDLRISTTFVVNGITAKYFYAPQSDITTFELARIVACLVAPHTDWLNQNADLRRHFREAR
jgi:hypothetical protein